MRTPRQNKRRSARDKRARLMPVWDAAKRKRFWLETARAVRPLWPGGRGRVESRDYLCKLFPLQSFPKLDFPSLLATAAREP